MSFSCELSALFFRYSELTKPWVIEYKKNAENLPDTDFNQFMKDKVRWYASILEGDHSIEHFNSVMNVQSRFEHFYPNVKNVDMISNQIMRFERLEEFIYDFEIDETMRIRETELDEEARVELLCIEQRFCDISGSYYRFRAAEREKEKTNLDQRIAAIISFSR